MEASEINQTRWEWHHTTFTPSLHLVPFCCHLHKYALCLLVVVDWCPQISICYSSPTVASELCTLHLFSFIISVIASYIVTRAKSMLLLLQLQNGNTVLLELYIYANCLKHTWLTKAAVALYYLVLSLRVSMKCIVLGTRANNCTFHCSWWYFQMHCVTAWDDLPAVVLYLKFSSAL